ncbi:MAG: hypothetical protein LQ341_003692 [Variospora aurantia]|nr:MAG: hypothetical protein LQ341_003692 [Variospora aurantia]
MASKAAKGSAAEPYRPDISNSIASQIGYDLLKQGYRVRGTTRSVESANALLKGAYSSHAHRVEILQVPDITSEGAFDEAVKGTTAIIHTASPISLALTSWSSTVDIAIAGAISMLNSALNHAGPRLSSFVLTSSFAACTDPQTPLPKTFTENDWNTWAEPKAKSKDFEDLDDNAKGRVLYLASKTAAERAVWEWREKREVSRNTGAELPPFAVSSINPNFVIGPPLQPPPDPRQINMTLQTAWAMISGTISSFLADLWAPWLLSAVIRTFYPEKSLVLTLCQLDHVPGAMPTAAYISNHDVSRMHVYAALHPSECNGHRYLLAAGRAPPQALADVLRKIRPQWKDRIPMGDPGNDYVEGYTWVEGGVTIDCERAKRALGGGEWMGFEQCVEETVEALEKHYNAFL